MKRKLGLIVAAVSLAASLSAFAACNKTEGGNSVGGGVSALAVFTASSTVIEFTDTTSVKDYLDALAEKGEISFTGEESTYGFYITSVYGIEEQINYTDTGSSGYSWMVYTDYIKGEDGVQYANPEYGVFYYNGKELASASYGVSYLPCVEGYTYALVYEGWSYSY